jgi:hypothetical protein
MWADPEYRVKMLGYLRRRWMNQAYCDGQSERAKRWWQNPEYRARQFEAIPKGKKRRGARTREAGVEL